MNTHLQGYSLDYFGRKRLSDSPYVHWVWMGLALRDGYQMTAADGNLDFAIIRRKGAIRFLLSGPTSRARRILYQAGDEVLSIRFYPGVYLADKQPKELVDLDFFLSPAAKQLFWFGSHTVEAPNFNNVEVFVDDLMQKGILGWDPIVDRALTEQIRGVGIRTVQQHFARSVGLSRKYITQIQRAEQASALLQQGQPIIRVAHETGFTDQSHLTNSLKFFTGFTPKRLQRLRQDW
jgi:hypothetical protein